GWIFFGVCLAVCFSADFRSLGHSAIQLESQAELEFETPVIRAKLIRSIPQGDFIRLAEEWGIDVSDYRSRVQVIQKIASRRGGSECVFSFEGAVACAGGFPKRKVPRDAHVYNELSRTPPVIAGNQRLSRGWIWIEQTIGSSDCAWNRSAR